DNLLALDVTGGWEASCLDRELGRNYRLAKWVYREYQPGQWGNTQEERDAFIRLTPDESAPDGSLAVELPKGHPLDGSRKSTVFAVGFPAVGYIESETEEWQGGVRVECLDSEVLRPFLLDGQAVRERVEKFIHSVGLNKADASRIRLLLEILLEHCYVLKNQLSL
ncbi:MAG TPA: hypothetical protein VJB65_05325, partial [Patescibacteria group bacterium]|nr:hypothetical protein [Patescibacteria group bacterium]